MITVREFRNLINSFGTDFKIGFQKLAHEPKGFDLVGLKIVDTEVNLFGNKVTIVLEETYNDEESMNNDIQDLRDFCNANDSYMLIDFRLNIGTETIPLTVNTGDVSWSDKLFLIDFTEN